MWHRTATLISFFHTVLATDLVASEIFPVAYVGYNYIVSEDMHSS